jgi:hypothetical protein
MPAPSQSRFPFQFRLRTYLIVTSVIGVSLGLLGKLYLDHPEVFFPVFAGIAALVPFVLAVATIARLGFRSQPVRRWDLILWSGLLLVMPPIGYVALYLMPRPVPVGSPAGLPSLTTQDLLQNRLPGQIDQPWVWNELTARLQAGRLSQAEADDAVQQLVAFMKTSEPGGWNKPLSWQREFLAAANQAGKVSEPLFLQLCDTYFGPKPAVNRFPRLREGQAGLSLELHCGNPFTDMSGLGVQLLWEVDRVLLDGKPIAVRRNYSNSRDWSGYYEGAIPVGDHQLTFEIESAYIDAAKLTGLNVGELAKSAWPQPRKRWKQTVTAPLKVFAADQTLVALCTDEAKDPGPDGGMLVSRLTVQADRDGKRRFLLRVQYPPNLPIPISYEVTAVVAGKPVKLGEPWAVQNGTMFTTTANFETVVPALDPSLRAVDLILTPNPRAIEHRPEVSEIWGKKLVLEKVPLERLDVDAAQGSPGR